MVYLYKFEDFHGWSVLESSTVCGPLRLYIVLQVITLHCSHLRTLPRFVFILSFVILLSHRFHSTEILEVLLQSETSILTILDRDFILGK